ncbi:MAG: DegT/DnrJ/EryC1/StrS family aminotransferase, partial [Chloroflexi bacterium]|nr:DegT/DnrJ/EryC1/StrS family aminotransferase [Chloroflexota bacterium]
MTDVKSKRIFLSPPHMGGEEIKFIQEAFESNYIAPLGPQVDVFEKEMAAYIGINHAAAFSSGTAALHLALRILGITENDVVFCSSLTFAASANPILYEKAIPVFIDSDRETWNMCPIALEKALNE